MGIFGKADAKGVAAQLIDDLASGRSDASKRAVDSMVKAGVSRSDAQQRVNEGMRDALTALARPGRRK